MAASRKAPRTVVADAPHLAEADDLIYTDELPAAEQVADASLCPTCGEPLTWHDEACLPTTPAAEATRPGGISTFAYALGRLVQPATQQQAHPVVWRGQLKERHPATGLVHRTNVYRLSDGYWDCYREEELQAA